MGFELRDYQKVIVAKGYDILQKYRMLYLAMEVRTGKTFCALFTVEDAEKVLFVTKKKAISSIKMDYADSGLDYDLTVINYESVHKIEKTRWDAIILDEAHGMGAYPKPSGRAKTIKQLLLDSPTAVVIYLSGTPTPESYSQMYHQMWVNPKSPLNIYKSFYAFANHHIDKKQKMVSYGRMINDYSHCRQEEVRELIGHLFIEYSQEEAGFDSKIEEEVLYVQMEKQTYDLCKRLQKDLVLGDKVVADTPVKLQSKLHQMYSGTIKLEDGKASAFDLSKAKYINSRFANRKVAIFYKFIAELDALKQVFGDSLTNDLEEFHNSDKSIALQIQSGREGTNLSLASDLIFYNIDFSATSYWQGRDRMTTKDRKENKVWWIFSKGGIEEKIYATVSQKKSYTTYYFKRDFGIKPKKPLILDL